MGTGGGEILTLDLPGLYRCMKTQDHGALPKVKGFLFPVFCSRWGFFLSKRPSWGRDERGCLLSIEKNAAVDVDLRKWQPALFNWSAKQIPEQWLISRIIPIHKKGDKNNISNYRPIANLCAMSKLFERFNSTINWMATPQPSTKFKLKSEQVSNFKLWSIQNRKKHYD